VGFSLKKLLHDAGDFVGLDGQFGYQGNQQASQPAPASTARPKQNFGDAVSGAVNKLGQTRLKGVEQLMGRDEEAANFNPVTVKDAFDETIKKPIVDPAMGVGDAIGQELIKHGAFGDDLKPFAHEVDPRKLAADTATTAVNALSAGQGTKALQTTKLLPRVLESAKVGGEFGGTQAAIDTFRDPNATAKDYIENAAKGAGAGAVIGGAIPAAPAATIKTARVVRDEARAGFPQMQNENGYIATPHAANYDKYIEKGKPETTFPDGAKGVEISDKGMKIKDQGLTKLTTGDHVGLSDLIEHKNLERDYPTFFGGGTGGIRVGFDASDPTVRAHYNPDTNAIHINPAAFGKDSAGVVNNLKTDNGKKILVHEISHAIDEYSGVPRGGSPEAVRAALQDPQVLEAENTAKAFEDGYKTLKSNRDAGLITPEQFASDPHVQAYEAARAVASQGGEPSPTDVWRAYNRQPNEQRANMTSDRAGMSQREIDKNPIGEQPVPFRLEGAPRTGDRMASMQQPDLTPDEIRQGIADGMLDPNTPTTQLVPPEVKMAVNARPGEVVENSLTRKGKAGDQNLSPELQDRISGEHERRNTQQLADEAVAAADQTGLDGTIQKAHKALGVEDGKISDKDVALAHQAIERADQAGRLDDANALHDALSNHLLAQGQSIQAASLLYRRSPQGMLHRAERDLTKAGVEVTEDMHKELQGFVDKIKGLPAGIEKDRAKAEMGQFVVNHMPKSTSKSLISVWKAGLLSGVKTQGGNFESNAAFGGLKKVADAPATAADMALYALGKTKVGAKLGLKGERTKTFTTKGIASGTKEGAIKGKDTLKTGLDERDFTGTADKYEQHGEINFDHGSTWGKVAQKVFGKPANLVFRGMKAADQPFHYATLKNTLFDMAKADGINKGLKGKELVAYMDKTVQNPPEAMAEKALTEATKGTLAHDTFAGSVVPAVKKGINNLPGFPEQAKELMTGAVDVVVPFSRIPAGFMSRTIDFTPLGVGREMVEQAWKGEIDQRKLSQAIGEGLTGTGAIVLGVGLAKSGQLSGDYPRNDQKEQERWKAEGITANSIKLGDTWVSLNYLGPLGLLFGAGKKMEDAGKAGSGAPGQIASAFAGLGQGLMGQSFLQGVGSLSDTINDPARNGMTFLKSQIGSLIPAWSNDIANLTDTKQRQSNNPIESAEARIPGLRENLNPKQDAFGNDLGQPDGGANVAWNPLKPSPDTSNELTAEIDRLKGTGKENFVMPTPDKAIDVGTETIRLNGDEQYAYNKVRGQETEKVWNQLIKSPEYQALNDTDKASALRGAMGDVNAVAKAQMLEAMGKTDQAKVVADKLSGNQYRIMTGGIVEPTDYIKDRTTTEEATGTPARSKSTKSAYETARVKYERDKEKMNGSERLKAERSLNTLKIKSDYDPEVVDFYNLSNADKSQLFKTDPEKAKQLYDKASELSSKLANAGLSSKKVSTSTGKKGSGGSKKGGRKGKLDITKGFSATRATGAKTTSALRKIVKGSTIKKRPVTAKRKALK
jgi:hypothetical protein